MAITFGPVDVVLSSRQIGFFYKIMGHMTATNATASHFGGFRKTKTLVVMNHDVWVILR